MNIQRIWIHMKNNTLNYISVFDITLFVVTVLTSTFVMYMMYTVTQ